MLIKRHQKSFGLWKKPGQLPIFLRKKGCSSLIFPLWVFPLIFLCKGCLLGCFLRCCCLGRFRRRGEEGVDPLLQAEEIGAEGLHVRLLPTSRIEGGEPFHRLAHQARHGVVGVGILLGPGRLSLLQFGLAGDVGRRHAPLLFLFGDGDQGGPGDQAVAPAVVAHLLRELVEAQDLGQGRSRLADDAAQLLLGVLLLGHEGLKALGLLDGGEVLAEQVFHQRDLGGVAFHTDPGKGEQTRLLGGLVAALAGDDDEVGVEISFQKDSSALSIPKGAAIEGIRIWVNVWIIMKALCSYHGQAVTTSVTSGHIVKREKL